MANLLKMQFETDRRMEKMAKEWEARMNWAEKNILELQAENNGLRQALDRERAQRRTKTSTEPAVIRPTPLPIFPVEETPVVGQVPKAPMQPLPPLEKTFGFVRTYPTVQVPSASRPE